MLGIGAFGQRMPGAGSTLPGRETPMPLRNNRHAVLGSPLRDAFAGLAQVQFGMGCFWGAERKFWQLPGVFSTAVGYAGGTTPNPTYREVCSGETGHAEVVQVTFDPAAVPFSSLLEVFWDNHNPTQGMRQGNDKGTQYRSAIYCDAGEQLELAQRTRDSFNERLRAAGFPAITTEIVAPQSAFYFAEDEHQQYLHKHPDGYCGLGGTGVCSVA